jgi:FixJ family two-component response regulator
MRAYNSLDIIAGHEPAFEWPITEFVKIFIIHPDPNYHYCMYNSFGKDGYDVFCYDDADIFFENFDPKEPSVIIIHSEVNGMKATEILNNFLAFKYPTPCIVLTVNQNQKDAIAALNNGAFKYIDLVDDDENFLKVLPTHIGLTKHEARSHVPTNSKELKLFAANISPERNLLKDRPNKEKEVHEYVMAAIPQAIENANKTSDALEADEFLKELTPTELKIFAWVVDGYETKSIANISHWKHETVKDHRKSIARKYRDFIAKDKPQDPSEGALKHAQGSQREDWQRLVGGSKKLSFLLDD